MTELALAGSAHPVVRRQGARSVSSQPPLSASVLRGADAYSALEADWRRLSAGQHSATLFQTPEMLSAWATHFAPRKVDRLATIVVRDGNRAVLIWPLLVERRGFITVATGAGAPLGQYDELLLDPYADATSAIKAAMDALSRTIRPDFIFLERVRADGALARALGDTVPLSCPEAAPYADLSGGVAALMAALKPRVARQQRKRVQRFKKEGCVSFEVADGPRQAEAWLAEAMAMKRKWLKSTGRISRAFVKPETGNCLADLARALSHPDSSPRMVVSRVTLDGRVAAIEMGFRQSDAYHLYLGAFDEALAKFGPGNILTERMLEWCAANGVQRYDMLAPRSRNKGEWQSGEVSVCDFALPMNVRGRLYIELVLKRIVPAARKAFYALPASFRSAVAGLTLRA
jgi:CelD/BcsL family acetyltransferase involved in cellulose biosynthesis